MSTYQTIVFTLVATAGLCFAQDRGTIRGTVTDPTGASVPGASVTAKNLQTGLSETAKTSGDGVYTIAFLPVGNYNVTTEKAGFRKFEIDNVRVDVNSDVPVNVQLPLGSVDQSVEVSAAAPLLEVTGENMGKVLTAQAIQDLPLSISGGLRSTESFVILTPGVIGATSNPRIGGGLASGQSLQLDGAESNSERRNDNAMNGISVEGVEEFKVQSSGYSAEYGRTSDGVINWATKSGTNSLHGDWFTFGINEFFNARGYTFTPTERPVNRQWNNGGTLGGPIYIPKVFDGRNKAFFFFTYERYDQRIGRSTSLTTVPVDAWRAGDFRSDVTSTGQIIPIYDPFDASGNIIANAANRQQIQCNGVLNVICPNRITPLAQQLLALLPQPDNPSLLTNNIRSDHGSTGTSAVPSIKGDYLFSPKNRMSVFFSRYNNPATLYQDTVAGVPPSGGWGTTNFIEYARVNDDHTISANLLNHMTLGFNHRHILENPTAISSQEQTNALGQSTYAPGNPTPWQSGRMTNFGSAGGVAFGTFVDTDSRQRTWNYKEQLAWLKGKHSVKFGFDYIRQLYRRLDYNDAFGTINWSATATGNPNVNGTNGSDLAAMLLGVSSGGTFRYPDDTTYQWPYYAWYAQDDIKLSSRLTVNIGLRYELPIPKQERNLHNSNFCPACPNPDAGGLLGSMVYAGINGQPDRFGLTRHNAVGPRLGFAYQLSPKTVVRAGSSIYYQPPREDGNADNGTQGYAGTYSPPSNYLSTGISMFAQNFTPGNPLYSQQAFLPFASAVKANLPVVADVNSIQLFGTPFWYLPGAGRTPYFGDWNLTIERMLSKSSVLRVSYHGTVGVRLLTDDQQSTLNDLDPKYIPIYGSLLSQPLSSLLSTPSTAATLAANGFHLPFTSCGNPNCPYTSYPLNLTLSQALRPYPQYNGIDAHAGANNDGHLTFHALEASFDHRFSHGLYVIANYTFAKTINNADNEDSDNGDSGTVQDPFNRRLDKAVSDQDTRHNIHIAYVYELPIGKGKPFLGNMPKVANAVFGNWRVSAIHTYVSGQPMQITCSQNMYGAAGTTRCSYAPGAGTTIPLINPAWNSSPTVAYSVAYLNPAAFVLPANGVFGNTPRYLDQLRGPWTVNEDAAILKNLHISEKKYFEIRATATDVLNRHVINTTPTTSFSSSTFGYLTSAQFNSPRSVQFGLKFIF
jgi:hypothetical protein